MFSILLVPLAFVASAFAQQSEADEVTSLRDAATAVLRTGIVVQDSPQAPVGEVFDGSYHSR